MDGQQTQPFSLETFSGEGLASARALWASIVGPHRLAMAAKKAVRLTTGDATELYKNMGASRGYVLIGVALPVGSPPTLSIVVGDSDQLGINTGTPQILTNHMGGGGLGVAGFMQLLLPGDQIYAQIVDPAFPQGNIQNVVVAAVTL